MVKCKYEVVLTDVEAEAAYAESDQNSWKPLIRQCMICSGLWASYFVEGINLGAPTVIIAGIRREANSTDAVSVEMSSWLSSMVSISSLPFILFLPCLLNIIGRKYTYFSVCLCGLLGYILFCHNTSIHYLLIIQVLFGVNSASIDTFTPILIAEYTSPKYRGMFLTIKSASAFWGMWVANAIGTYYSWHTIGIVGLCFCMYTMIVIAWPESPYWLAMKGRYAECVKSHRWLKGTSAASEKELSFLINSKTQPETESPCREGRFDHFSNIWATVKSGTFYKPTLLSILLFAQYQFTGKFVCAIYAIEVLKNITKDDSLAYKGMLILDGVTVISMYVGCILSRYFKRRTLLFLFTFIGILFLYSMSLYLYLVSSFVIKENNVVAISLLTSFSIAIGCGPMILASSIYGELVPSKYQTPIMIIVGLCTCIIMSLLLKLAPYMFLMFSMCGTFLFFALASSILIIILYLYLPETKDKTILEIETYFHSTENLKERNN